MPAIIEINEDQFEGLVLKAKKPVVLEFMSPECIICKTMKERIKEVSGKFKERVLFFRLDINKTSLWKKYNIRSIPALLYFKKGQLAARQDLFPEKEEMRSTLEWLLK